MKPITEIKGRGLPLLIDDIDTDRIIPARFLRTVTFEGIGENVFSDERFNEKGEKTDFPMNNIKFEGAEIILSGKNFGCGSSREHAPQAIKRAGFKAVIAESFAEIFFGNSTTIGIPCLCMEKSDIAKICNAVNEDPKCEIAIDMNAKTVSCKNNNLKFTMPETARQAIADGTYDLLPELIKNAQVIKTVNDKLMY